MPLDLVAQLQIGYGNVDVINNICVREEVLLISCMKKMRTRSVRLFQYYEFMGCRVA
jgi:hypothetical protein